MTKTSTKCETIRTKRVLDWGIIIINRLSLMLQKPLHVLPPTHRRPIPQGDFKHGQHRAREPRHISAFKITISLRKMMIGDDDSGCFH